MKTMKKIINNKGWSNLFLDSILSSLFITILVIAFEIAFYLIVINDEIENSTRSFINKMNPIYIDLNGQLNTNSLYKMLNANQKKIIYNNLKASISDLVKKTVDQIESDIASRRKNIMIIMFCIYGAIIIATFILSIVLRKKFAWVQILLFSIITLLMIGGAEAYLYFDVYSKLHTINGARMISEINQAIKNSLS